MAPEKMSPAATQLLSLSEAQVELLEETRDKVASIEENVAGLMGIADLIMNVLVKIAEAGRAINGSTISDVLAEKVPELRKDGVISDES